MLGEGRQAQILTTCLAVMLAGCATSPIALSRATPDQLKPIATIKLCDAYIANNQAKLLDEIRARNEFSAEDLAAISTHSLRVGMTEKAARCSRGDTYITTKIALDPGVTKWVFWDSGGYLFIKDGIVTSFRN
jgi:hypothetical protein